MQRLSSGLTTESSIRYVSVPSALRLRPLEIGDLLDETFRMYRRHFVLFAGISVILAIPSAALFGLGFGSFFAALSGSGRAGDSSSFTLLFVALAVALFLGILLLPFTHTAVLYAACESAQGRPVTAGGIFSGVMRRYFPLLGYWFLFNQLTAELAVSLCLVPLVFWLWGFITWFVVTPAMFVENVGLGAAFGRSAHLVHGRWWRTFLIFFLLLVVWLAAYIGLGAFVQLAQYLLGIFVSQVVATAVATASGQLVVALVNPLMQIAIVLVYFDLRVRKEGLDLFLMASRLSARAQVAS